MDSYRRGDLTFDVIDRGPDTPPAGPPVVLLHGFPQFNTCWEPVIQRLVAHGHRCLAPNQRGYAAGARPPRRRDYQLPFLAADVIALIDEIDRGPVHLVGHDWGAAVAWQVAATAPERVVTLSALSVPHPAAYRKAVLTSRQVLASSYIYAFQLPRIPERQLSRHGGLGLARSLERLTGQERELAERDGRAMVETGALTGALNWYRALPLTPPSRGAGRVRVPTMMIWSDGDTAIQEPGVRDCADYVTGEYRLEILRGVTHWIPDECPDRAAELLLEWFAAHTPHTT